MLTKIALTAAIIFGTASVALATEHDSNLANRYPSFTGPAAVQTLQSAPVSLQSRNVSGGGQFVISGDRASSPSAGGVG
jgi:hypothetical protein